MFLDSSMNPNIGKPGKSSIVKKRSLGSNKLTMPNQIPLDSLVYHFKWDICKITPTTLQERILSVEGHLRENSSGILPQSYCLLAYLKSKADTDEEVETNNEIYSLLVDAEKSLPEIDESSTKKGLGYKAVVIGNLIYWEQCKIKKYEQARKHFEEYKKLKCKYDGCLESHPEVLAMKAFAFGYSFGIKKSSNSVKYYTEALSDKDYMDNAEWIYGLAHSKSVVALKEEPQRESDLIEIEQLLRRAIHVDPNYSLAMLKLAKTLIKLHGINVFDEVEDWIEKALDVSNRKLSCLEEAASIYQQALKYRKSTYVTGKDRKRNNEKAMELYKEAEKINPSSKRTIIGIGKCHLNNYYDRKKRESNRENLCDRILPKELGKAQTYFEKDSEHKRHIDKLKLAQVYREVSLFKGKKDFLVKAENIYKKVIKLTEEEKDPLRLVEAYTRYATFLKMNDRVKEEIDYLREGVNVTVDCDEEEDSEMRFSRECQDRLLFYASQGNHMTKQESLVVKAHVQRKRGHIMTSCHYLNQAIKLESTDEYKSYLREELAECTLQASEVQQTPCANAMSDVYFDEAKKMIAALDDTDRKFDLEFEVARKEINKSMGQAKQLESLKEHRLKFEECCMETNKNMLKGMKEEKLSLSDKKQEREKEEDRELKVLVDFICETKRVLDGAMNTIKQKIFGKSAATKPSCYYPTPSAYTLNESRENFEKSSDLTKQMKHLLEKRYKLDGFQEKLPDLFDYLVQKQPNYSKGQYVWLQDVIDIRNESQHSTKSIEMLKEFCPTREKQRMLIQQISQYAAEINTRIQSEVKNYLKTQNYSDKGLEK